MNYLNNEKPFDKYFYYTQSVQSVDTDVIFFNKVYKELNKTKPFSLREDFCGTFALCCAWVKSGSDKQACGVDLSAEPTEYGKKYYLSQLSAEEKKDIRVCNQNVLLSDNCGKFDLVVAQNFSYCAIKQRKNLLKYFTQSKKRLNKNGLFVLDCFGGEQCSSPNEEETVHKEEGFSYFWDQDSFDPTNNEAQFYIHFKMKGKKKHKKVFEYDWRLWTLPELKELLLEAGFSDVFIYWEKDDNEGGGSGDFYITAGEENCEAWIAYIVARA